MRRLPHLVRRLVRGTGLAALAAATASVALAPPGGGAVAAWTTGAVRTTGPVSAATLGHSFTPVGGTGTGTGGSTYTTATVLSLFPHRLVALRNTSSVPAELSGTVDLDNLLATVTVRVERCPQPWSAAGACATPTVLFDGIALTTRPVATAAARPAREPADRTGT